ncbi:MAG: hypothetical protein HY461_02625 [Parcubacteria group bacterium]|nr:hypothetical protein [Parcubacteria group bacterium]
MYQKLSDKMGTGTHRVKVILDSKTKFEWQTHDGEYIIHVNADSAQAANAVLRAFIAKELKKLPGKIHITSGLASTEKIVEVF